VLPPDIANVAIKTTTTLRKSDLEDAHKESFRAAQGQAARGVGKSFEQLLERLVDAKAARYVTETVFRERKQPVVQPKAIEATNGEQ